MKKNEEILKKEIEGYSDYKLIYQCLALLLETKGKNSIQQYLKDKHICNIVIYGAGCVGKVLSQYINEMDTCNILGIIDINKNTAYGFDKFIDLSELKTIDYDLCIVTPVHKYDVICQALNKNGIQKYCSVWELIDYLRRNQMYENDISC